MNSSDFEDEIRETKKYFRILRGCKVRASRGNEKGTKRIICSNKAKEGVIYPYSNTGKRAPIDYVTHELLHMCFERYRNTPKDKRDKVEERFIHDICTLIYPED